MNDVMNPGKVIAEALSRTDKKEYLRDLGLYELNALDKDDYYWLIHEESKNSNVTNYNGTKVSLGKLSNLAMDVEAREWVQSINFDINVVPYGSGSSFLGFIQRYWIDKNRGTLDKDYWEEVKQRNGNLWDDEYGVTFRSMNTLEDTKHNEFVNLTIQAEELVRQAVHGLTSWQDVWAMYCKIVKFAYDNKQHHNNQIELTVHDWLFCLDFLVPKLNCKLFLDLDFEIFVWCYLLSQYKHDRPHVRKFVNNVNDEDYFHRFRIAKMEVLRYWRHYSLCKQYIPKQHIFSYDKIFFEKDPNEIQRFLEITVPEFSSPKGEDLEYIVNLIDEYTTRNNELVDLQNITQKWAQFRDQI